MALSSYLHAVLDPARRKKVISNTVRVLKPLKEKLGFTAIAFRGMSGALVAPVVADKLGVDLIMVRKPHNEEKRHSPFDVEGELVEGTTYIIVDDFICSGETVTNIIEQLNKHDMVNVGVYEYLYKHVAPYRVTELSQDLDITSLNRIGNGTISL